MVFRSIGSAIKDLYDLFTGASAELIEQVVDRTLGAALAVIFAGFANILLVAHDFLVAVYTQTPYPGKESGSVNIWGPDNNPDDPFNALMEIASGTMEPVAILLVGFGIVLVYFFSIFDVVIDDFGWATGKAKKRLLMAPFLIVLWVPLASLILYMGDGFTTLFSEIDFDSYSGEHGDVSGGFSTYIDDMTSGPGSSDNNTVVLMFGLIALFIASMLYIVLASLGFIRLFLIYTIFIIGPLAIAMWAFSWEKFEEMGVKFINWFVLLAIAFPVLVQLFETVLPLVFDATEIGLENTLDGTGMGGDGGFDLHELTQVMFIIAAPAIIGILPWGVLIGFNKALGAATAATGVGAAATAAGTVGAAVKTGSATRKNAPIAAGKANNYTEQLAQKDTATGQLASGARKLGSGATAAGAGVAGGLASAGGSVKSATGKATPDPVATKAKSYGGAIKESVEQKKKQEIDQGAGGYIDAIERKAVSTGMLSQYGGGVGDALHKSAEKHTGYTHSDTREELRKKKMHKEQELRKGDEEESIGEYEAFADVIAGENSDIDTSDISGDQMKELFRHTKKSAANDTEFNVNDLGEDTIEQVAKNAGVSKDLVDEEAVLHEYMTADQDEWDEMFDKHEQEKIQDAVKSVDEGDVRDRAMQDDKNNVFVRNKNNEDFQNLVDEMHKNDKNMAEHLYGGRLDSEFGDDDHYSQYDIMDELVGGMGEDVEMDPQTRDKLKIAANEMGVNIGSQVTQEFGNEISNTAEDGVITENEMRKIAEDMEGSGIDEMVEKRKEAMISHAESSGKTLDDSDIQEIEETARKDVDKMVTAFGQELSLENDVVPLTDEIESSVDNVFEQAVDQAEIENDPEGAVRNIETMFEDAGREWNNEIESAAKDMVDAFENENMSVQEYMEESMDEWESTVEDRSDLLRQMKRIGHAEGSATDMGSIDEVLEGQDASENVDDSTIENLQEHGFDLE